jgi:triosephosphate isomerase
MVRRTLIAGNWKLNLTVSEGLNLVQGLADVAAASTAEVVVFPTTLSIAPVAEACANSAVSVGVQHIHWQASGAFTGEASAPLAQAAGCEWVLIGHSERRQFFGETDETVNKRLLATLDAGLKPMVCIGETLAEREGGQLETVLRTQITGAIGDCSAAALSDLVIAYEPVWAIGTGVVATDEQAQDAHAFVRSVVAEVLGAAAATDMRILYGGSVKPDNAAGLLEKADIDGALVGGASLKADSFTGIIEAAAAASV